jgi:SAM-dependent methyltransferase
MKITSPAFNYNAHGSDYSAYRRTDPRIAQYVHEALGEARTILNVGAGAGSYEPFDRYVVAIEPSSVMRSQRSDKHVPALNGKAEALPFDDNAFDAVMAMVTVHHWLYMKKGLKELKRVSRKKVLVLSFDPEALDNFWMAGYAPELIAVEKLRYPTIDFVIRALGGQAEVIDIPVPFDCTDGFQEAFFGRPEAFLDPQIRKSQSAWGFLEKGKEKEIVGRLKRSMESGEWDERYGHLRKQEEFTCALKLIVVNY